MNTKGTYLRHRHVNPRPQRPLNSQTKFLKQVSQYPNITGGRFSRPQPGGARVRITKPSSPSPPPESQATLTLSPFPSLLPLNPAHPPTVPLHTLRQTIHELAASPNSTRNNRDKCRISAANFHAAHPTALRVFSIPHRGRLSDRACSREKGTVDVGGFIDWGWGCIGEGAGAGEEGEEEGGTHLVDGVVPLV